MRDRPICDVLNDIKVLADSSIADRDEKIIKLADEALGYAKRMQARLQQNKKDILRLTGNGASV